MYHLLIHSPDTHKSQDGSNQNSVWVSCVGGRVPAGGAIRGCIGSGPLRMHWQRQDSDPGTWSVHEHLRTHLNCCPAGSPLHLLSLEDL